MTGFMKHEPHHVDITVHADDVRAGSLFDVPSDILLPLCESMTSGGLSCVTTDTVEKDLWAKMLYNCSLNPLGAMFNVKYGALAASSHTMDIMNSIIDEIFRVMHSAGYSTHWETPDEYRDLFYEKLVPATAEHQSSMLQDIRAGRRTEINAMNGAVVALADEHNLEVPVNRTITGMIHFIEG
jgi:2-dehydropantoate 2-reductase